MLCQADRANKKPAGAGGLGSVLIVSFGYLKALRSPS